MKSWKLGGRNIFYWIYYNK